MRRRKFLLGSAGLASAGLLTGADAFSSTTATRQLSVTAVDDPDAYLGLDETGVETDLLFSGGARTAPAEFEMRNGLPDPVMVTITLENKRFAFADGSDGSTSLQLDPGDTEKITAELSGDPVESVTDTLSFSVEGESVAIDATRELTLEPEEIDADVRLANTEAALQFHRPSADLVDLGSVVVIIEDETEIHTTTKGDSDNLTLAPNGQHVPGCNKPSNIVSLTVKGKTTDDIDFSGSLGEVNCSGSQGEGNGDGNSGNGEKQEDEDEEEEEDEDEQEDD